jgi:hypothetical protein
MNRATTQRRHIFKGFSVATLLKENDRSDQKKDLVGNSSHLIQQVTEEDQGLLSETKTKKLERRCSFFFSHQTNDMHLLLFPGPFLWSAVSDSDR